MRSPEQMYEQILAFAKNDDRVRCVYLNSTRVDESYCDKYSDFDLVFIVRDIGSFINNDRWLDVFGQILVMQKTSDELDTPYDYEGFDNFIYLMQYYDGNRIDLTLVDMRNIEYAINHTNEPRKVLLDKDGFNLSDIAYKGFYRIDKPVERAFDEAVNEFWWMAVVSAKGLCRNDITYVKAMMEHYQFRPFCRMLDWLTGIRTDFQAEGEKYSKNCKHYLKIKEYKQLCDSFGGGCMDDIWNSLFRRSYFFKQTSHEVASYFSYSVKEQEDDILALLLKMRYDQL